MGNRPFLNGLLLHNVCFQPWYPYFRNIFLRRQKFAELKSIQERKKDQSQREDWLEATKVGSERRNRWGVSYHVKTFWNNQFSNHCQKWKFLGQWFYRQVCGKTGREHLYPSALVHAGLAGVDKERDTPLWAADVVAHQCFAWGVCGSVLQVWFHWGAIPTTRRRRWRTWLHSPNCFATWTAQAGQCPVGNAMPNRQLAVGCKKRRMPASAMSRWPISMTPKTCNINNKDKQWPLNHTHTKLQMLQQIQLTIYRNIQRSNSRFMRRQYLDHPHHSRSLWSKQGRCWMTWRVTVSSAWSHGDSDHFPPTNDSDRLLPQRLPSTRVGGSWQREQASMGSFGRGLFWKEGIYEREVTVGGDVILEYNIVLDNFCFGIHPKFLSFEIEHHALDAAKCQPTLKANKGMKKRLSE